MSALIDLLPIALLLLMLWRVRPAKPLLSGFHEDALSLQAALPLRGALAVMVVFHHLAQRTEAGWLMRLYTDAGYLPVAMFFFLSGYGLMKRHLSSPDYRRHFLRRRLGALLGPIALPMAVYIAMHIASQPFTSAWDFYNGVIGEANAWFIMNLIVFYLEFALAMRLCGKRPGGMVAIMAACCAGYIAGCMALQYGDWWYKSSPAFVIGMACAAWGGRWKPFVRRFYWPLLIACWALCHVVHVNIWTVGWRLHTQALIPSALAATLFALGTALLMMKLRFGNPALNWLGRHSYDIYIIHGILLIALHGGLVYLENDFLYALPLLIGTFALAEARRALRSKWKNMRNKSIRRGETK